MAAQGNDDTAAETQTSLPTPPPLSTRLLDIWPVVVVGTSAWFVAFVALLIARYGFDATPPIWLWTTIYGWILGILGTALFWWQRAASRRGSKGAQRF